MAIKSILSTEMITAPRTVEIRMETKYAAHCDSRLEIFANKYHAIKDEPSINTAAIIKYPIKTCVAFRSGKPFIAIIKKNAKAAQ